MAAPEPPLYTLPLPASSHPPSPLHPPISFSPPPSPAAASSHATSPAPSTIAGRITSPAIDPLHLSDHASEPEHEIDDFPVPVVDPDSDYEPAVDLRSPSPPLPIHGQPLRGQPRGRPRGRPRGQARGQARGQPRGRGQGAQPRMPPALNRACRPYNDAWLPHRLSAYGNSVCSFCHAKHWVEEKQRDSTIHNPLFTQCCNAGKVCYIYFNDWASGLLY